MTDGLIIAIFGSLVSFLLGILTIIGRNLTKELQEVGRTVSSHGRQLSSIDVTLKHLDRRADVLESKND